MAKTKKENKMDEKLSKYDDPEINFDTEDYQFGLEDLKTHFNVDHAMGAAASKFVAGGIESQDD